MAPMRYRLLMYIRIWYNALPKGTATQYQCYYVVRSDDCCPPRVVVAPLEQ